MAIVLEKVPIVMAKDKKLTDSNKATYLRSALNSKEAIQIITSQHGGTITMRWSQLSKGDTVNLVVSSENKCNPWYSSSSLDVHIGHMPQHKENFFDYFLQGQFTQIHLVITLLESNMTEDVFQDWSHYRRRQRCS